MLFTTDMIIDRMNNAGSKFFCAENMRGASSRVLEDTWQGNNDHVFFVTSEKDKYASKPLRKYSVRCYSIAENRILPSNGHYMAYASARTAKSAAKAIATVEKNEAK